MGKSQRDRKREGKRVAAASNQQPPSSPPHLWASSSSSSHVRGEPSSRPSAGGPAPAAGGWPALPCASTTKKNKEIYCKYLHESGDQGLSCTVNATKKQMMALKALDLTRTTCNDSHNSEDDWLPAAASARQFLKEKYFGYEVGRPNNKLLYYSDFPESMRNLQDFYLDGDFVETVRLFGGNISVDTPTARGRRFLQMLVLALFENHSNRIFWDGNFSLGNIVIFCYKSESRWIEILEKPVEADNWTEISCNEAKVKDMARVVDLITLFYKKSECLPLYFDELIKDLKSVTNEDVGEPCFREYLSHHVAFMRSDARKFLEKTLHNIYTNCKGCYMPFMKTIPTMYLDDWKTRLKRVDDNSYIKNLLNGVYCHNKQQQHHDNYAQTVFGLMTFKRNVLEHGGQYITNIKSCDLWHLELCAAHRFSEFLPSLVHTLLAGGQMETVFKEAWKGFKRQGREESDF